MKSVDPGILPQSECFTFQPTEFARDTLLYVTWCGHYFCTEQYYMERDSYPFQLMLFIRHGKMDVQYGGSAYIAEKGDVVLMNCQHPHYYRAQKGLEFVYIHFDGITAPGMVDYLIELNGSPIFRQEGNIQVGKELYELVQKHSKGTVQNGFHVSCWITNLLDQLSISAIPTIREDTPVDCAIHYILENVGEPISLDDLSRVTNFSPYYLSHTFKKQTGYSPSEFIINTRLEKAQILLTHSHMRVGEIAFQVGYNSASSFINVFAKKVGYTPSEYRNMQQNKKAPN